MKDLNIKLATLNLIEERVWDSLEYIGIGKDFLKRIPIVKAIRLTINT